jgi:CubicO group peptidase (beta-lactamase class C family)/lysophospholipase L1-like esterase
MNVARQLLASTALALAALLPPAASWAQAPSGAAAQAPSAAGTQRFHFGSGPTPAGAVRVAADTPYSAERGHGFEPPSTPSAGARHFSVALPEGSYRITATLGGAPAAGTATIQAELRRLVLQNLPTAARRAVDASFTVHVRNALIGAGPNRAAGHVALREPRESVDEAWNWDGKLTLEIHGAPASLRSLRIEPVRVPLLFLLGDSTVADQPHEPHASWGQMLPRWLGPGAAVVNLAQSGESFRDSLQRRRLDKILALARPGDAVLMQYGHNDQKQLRDGSGSVASYQAEMRQHITALQAARLQPVLVTPVERRFFEPDGSLRATLADHVTAMRAVASETQVPLLDLNAASRTLYAAYGPAHAPALFATGPDGRADPTHHNKRGAWLLAGLVAQGLQELKLPIAAQLRPDAPAVRAAQPPALADIAIADSPLTPPQRPAGDTETAAHTSSRAPTGAGAAPVYPERIARLQAAVQREIDQGRLAGAVTYLARHGQPVFFQAQGLARVEEKEAMRPDTLFRLASMSKAVTTVAAMMLYEEGHFLLRDPIHKWLPAFANVQVAVAPPAGSPPGAAPRLEKPRRAITVRDLLLHTAGLTYGTGPAADEWQRAGFNDWYLLHLDETLAQWTDRLAQLPLQGHPGDAFQYGYATDVLGRLIEIWSGLPLERFVEQRITQPLRMPDTHFFLPPEKAPRLAHVYALEAGRLALKETPANSDFLRGPRKLASGGAGLISSAPDYARFLQMLLNGGVLDGVRLLHPATVAMMTRDHLGAKFTGDAEGAGFGYWVAANPGTRSELASPGAYGWGSAYVPQYMVDPATHSVFIFLAQLRPAGDSTLNQRVKVLARQAIAD